MGYHIYTMNKTDYELQQLLSQHIVTCYGEPVVVIPSGNGYHFTLSFLSDREDMPVDRDALFSLHIEGKLRFFREITLESDLRSALWDWD